MATVDRPTFPSDGKAPDPDITAENTQNKPRKKKRKGGANHKEKKKSKHSSRHKLTSELEIPVELSKVKQLGLGLNIAGSGTNDATEALQHRVSTGGLRDARQHRVSTGGLRDARIYNKGEEDARIAAAEAMSALAAGCFSHNSNISSHGPNSDRSSDNDSVLVIDCPGIEEVSSPTLTLNHKLSRHVQEDVVSSSSIHKQSINSQKSPNILSILENRVIPVVNDKQTGPTVVAPQLIFVAGNVNDGMLIDQSTSVIKPNSQSSSLHARGTSNTLPTVVNANNSLALAPFQCMPVMNDYCPPTKRSRTVETQTSQSAETKIPDFNKLTLNASESHIPKHSNDISIKKNSKRRTQIPSSVFIDGKKNLSSCTSNDGLRAVDLRKPPNGLDEIMSSEVYVSKWLDSCSSHSTPTDPETHEKRSELVSGMPTVSNPPSFSMETDEGLQIAQQNALKRLKDDLARASPKERAFMLGQIQAIVTMQKRQPIGIWSMGSLLNRQINQSSSSQNIVRAEKSQPLAISAPVKHYSQNNGQIGNQEISKVVDIRTGQSFPVELHRFGGQKSGPQQRNDNQFKSSPISSNIIQVYCESNNKLPTMSGTSLGRTLSPSNTPESTLSPNIPVVTNNLLPISAINRSKSLSPIPVKTSDTGSHLPFKKRRMLVTSAGDIASPGDTQDRLVEVIRSPPSTQNLVPKINSQTTTPSSNVGRGTSFFNRVPDLKDVEIALKKDEDGDIPLHIAVAQENIMAVMKYISLMRLANVPVDAFNKDRQTPMHLAVVMNQKSVVEILLQANSNVNLPNNIGQSALHLAAKGGYCDCMNLLLLKTRHPVHLNKKDFEGYSPLHLSVQRGDFNVTRLLIEHNADTNVQDGKSGRTPLFHAAEKNLLVIVDMLLKAEAKVNVMNYAGITAVMAASGRGYKEVVTLLMQYGADTRGTNIGDLTSKGPPVRNTTSSALRQAMYSPYPGSDDSNMSSKQRTKKQ